MENIEVKSAKLKLKDIVKSIEHMFDEQVKKDYGKKYEKEVEEFKATDFIYTNLIKLGKDKDETVKADLTWWTEKYLSLKLPKKFQYVTYAQTETINERATMYLMDNSNCKFKELYEFCTKDLNNE